MFYSPVIQKAITLASEAHRHQKRKGNAIPYISHPLGVALMLARAGATEDVICAGILHDTIEDTDMTYEDLAREFGTEVADMVNDVTEQDRTLTWEERKQAAFEHIAHMTNGSRMVKAADVLYNLSDQIEGHKTLGDDHFKMFRAKKERQIMHYSRVVASLEEHWPENPLLPELKEKIAYIQQHWV